MTSEQKAETPEAEVSTRKVARVQDHIPASIKVIGVGGGGVNVILRMLSTPVPGVDFIAINTDIKSLDRVKASATEIRSIQIGEAVTRGLGAGGNPEVGYQAAESGQTQLKNAIKKSDLVFITAGMGGGTGTGAAPVVAEIARKAGALVVGVVTTPFSFEGARRMETAMNGVARLQPHVDNLIVIHNDRLLQLVDKDVPMEEAFRRADEAVTQGVMAIAQLVNVPGEINVDLADVRTIMKIPGRALMAVGEGQGQGGALDAAKKAVLNPLLKMSITGAKGVLFNINAGPRLTLGEVNSAGEFIAGKVDPDAMIFFGMVNDPSLADSVKLTLIATGIPASPSQSQPSGR